MIGARMDIAIDKQRLVLADFHDAHRGDTIIVCGCGESLNLLEQPERYVTIGVNDVGRRFTPDYLVVVNPRSQFSSERFSYVERSKARTLFTQVTDLGVPHPHVVHFGLGQYGGTDLSDPNVLPYTQNSPYVAVCLAALMGAKRIGLIGVDFTDNHFFGSTGAHPLAAQLSTIDEQYRRLGEALQGRGIEVVNLSPVSHLTAFPKKLLCEFARNGTQALDAPGYSHKRIFFVNYRFLSAGDVFATGLRRAAASLQLEAADSWWDDPGLEEKIREFNPDLIFVVHGRRFVQRWRDTFTRYRTAVWLVDEPYEVDDTASWSSTFDYVFLNDPATLSRHRNATYLPTAYDPELHFSDGRARDYNVGFVGGYNSVREQSLLALDEAGCLSYVVGGPWREPRLQNLSLAPNLPPAEVAELYRRTKIIVNVFREVHHYNRATIPASSLNPRIYEALACGAAVISEVRPEILEMFPELPTFSSNEQLITGVQELLATEDKRNDILFGSRVRLRDHTYATRLGTALAIAFPESRRHCPTPAVEIRHPVNVSRGSESFVILSALKSNGHVPGALHSTSALPKRNLIYHIWPVKGSLWSWNIEQLLQRIDIFNGRRIISIFHDERSEDAETVTRLLAGHGCEFVIARNDLRGESAVFGRLLDTLRTTENNEVTFYAHAKGVKYGSNVSWPVKKWAETLYRVNLDDWLSVKAQLNQYAMTGAFKMLGRFTAHRNIGDWHYSGTFFWFRNADVFARDYRNVPDFYGGVEAWPGVMFSARETGCLFLDSVHQLGYHERFWRDLGEPALGQWESRRQEISAPPDLEKPVGYDGYERPRLEQLPGEFDWWIQTIINEGVRSLLTIGAGEGGVEWHVARKFHEMGIDIAIDVVDISDRVELVQTLEYARNRFNQKIEFVKGDSSLKSTRERLQRRYDAVFIDSDHSFQGVSSDFELALAVNPRVIGLHDIVDLDWHAHARCCVSRIWGQLVKDYRTDERRSAEWGGIGIVWPRERKQQSFLQNGLTTATVYFMPETRE
jgi:Glycosyl transferases group 1